MGSSPDRLGLQPLECRITPANARHIPLTRRLGTLKSVTFSSPLGCGLAMREPVSTHRQKGHVINPSCVTLSRQREHSTWKQQCISTERLSS
mmetsp:Transcript_30357/g.80882  ORF Transcript_30357/g.80882 Transcript_30357/m.80882 type:complete len:92 (-) Transcript_30357:563-838(-)